jgi:membrane-associated phospholipid phosphatase
MEEYFFTLGLANVLCDLGFIFFPVASPLYWMADQYSVPLDGWLFAWLGEFIRFHLHYPGGSLPSPHAAAATVMWLMAWKHHRPTCYLITPVILSLYVSTFYGRYHYLTDAAVGIGTALLAAWIATRLLRLWHQQRPSAQTSIDSGGPAE